MRRKVFQAVKVGLTDFARSNCPHVAAGIAYWTLFSLFPLSLAGISILGYVYPSPEDQGSIVEGIVKLVPVSVDYLAELIEDVTRSRGTLGGLAIVGLLWTGTAVFSAVRKGINHTWHIGRPHFFLLERAIDLAMLLWVALLAFIQVAIVTDLFGLASIPDSAERSAFWPVFKVLSELSALGITFGMFLLLYRYVPNTKVVWRDLWVGAAVGATLFQGVRIGFAWFLSNFGHFNLVYGSLGAVMAVLAWAYLAALAIMLGSQAAYTYRGVFGSQAGTIALPAPRPRAQGRSRPHGVRGIVTATWQWMQPADEEPK
jgi:membrane protein